MSDAGEGLVDTEARLQERIDERGDVRRRGRGRPAARDREARREIESLRLARAELEHQASATAHPVRRQQIDLALVEIDRRLAAFAE